MGRAEKSAIIKRFQSYGNDSMAYSRDHFEKNKCEECCELQGGRLNFYESGKPQHNTTATVVKVEKRRGTNILILRCGPGGRSVIFLEFDSKRSTDEWQEALCQYTGQSHVPNHDLRRVRSELPAVVRRKRIARTQSTFSDFVFEQVDSDSEQDEASLETSQEAPLEAPPEALPAPPVTTPETPQEAPPAPPVTTPETPQEAPLEVRQEPHPAPPVTTLETPQEAPPAPPVTTPETPKEASLEARQEPHPAPRVTTPETPQEAPLEARQEPHPAPPVTTPETPQEPHPAPPVTAPETPQEAPLEARQEPHPAPPVTTPETPQEVPLEAPQEAPLEGRQGALPAPPVTSPETPQETSETDDRDDSQNDSGPGPLRSRDNNSIPTLEDLDKNSVEKECTLSDLEQLKVKDCGGDVIVKEAIPRCNIHVGDKMVLTNNQGLPMNAREITEHIRTSPEQTIVLTIVRGAVGIVRKEEFELVINIKGSQTVILDTVDLIRRACTPPCSLPYAEMPERSNLTITAINDIPVVIGSQPEQIAKSMREALETSIGGITLRLVPQSLLDYLAEEDDDTHEEQAHDMVND